MDESEDNLSSEDMKSTDSPSFPKTKPKKRSLIERELETNLTARVTSPVCSNDGKNTSRYGRALRFKSQLEQPIVKKANVDLKSPLPEKSPIKAQSQSPVYKMYASNTPQKSMESPKQVVEKFLDSQIQNIYEENKSLSRFTNEDDTSLTPSPGKKYPKVYIRKDLIQKREPEDTVMVIQNMFSPVRSVKKSTNTHLNNILERSCERYSLNSKQQNGYIDNSSVVKTLDFDTKKKKKESKDNNPTQSKGELFELEAKCPYQVGDLAWARMGTFPFWPCIVTRDPLNGLFVKKKLFGRIERDVIHVTFFGDNGRRSWIVDNMLRNYLGLAEFESTRDNFTPQDKKKDPKLYAAYFISEKKQVLWNTSVEEAEALLKEPKRFRIDIFNDMLIKSQSTKSKQPKSKVSRTDSDVSLSESLYDSLFSEDDGKSDNSDKSRNRSRNKSLDMFEVVTACLDNMAAKTGITKIQRQSHMDIWLQKAKSKTPEKTKALLQAPMKKLEEKKESKISCAEEKKSTPAKRVVPQGYSLRKKKVRVSNELRGYEYDYDFNRNSQGDNVDKNSDNTSTNSEVKEFFPEEAAIMIKDESLPGKAVNRTECSVDTNASCVSDTFTDESIDSNNMIHFGNNSTTDNTLPLLEKSNLSHNSQDLSLNKLDLEKGQGIELINDKVSEESAIVPKSKADFELNCTYDEGLNNNESMNSKNSNNINMCKLGKNINQEKTFDLKNSSECFDSCSENSKHLRNSDKTVGTDNQSTELITPNKDNKIDTVSNMGFQCRSEAIDINIQDKDLQENSNLRSTVLSKSTDVHDISSKAVGMQNQTHSVHDSVNIYCHSIKNNQDVTNNMNEIEASTPKINDKCLAILEDYIVNKEKDNDIDNMSVDEDSDSERLPYSPLSNLGNNSDDNLSLDDVPFVADDINENELESQNLCSENVNASNETTNLITNIIETTENLSKDTTQLNNPETIETLLDISISTGKTLIDKIQESKHVNGETENVSKSKGFDKVSEEAINKNDKEVTTTCDKVKHDNENVSNGYKGKNVREVNLKTKEVRIYVSDCIPPSIKENGYRDMVKELGNTETISVHSEDSIGLPNLDSRRTLRSQKDNSQEDPRNNPEFMKYMELRQDAILDENPELDEKDVIAYLHKTWLYEQNIKSDVIKSDESRECNLIKGLNPVQSDLPPRKRQLSLKKNQPSKSNTGSLKMFLRRNKDASKHNNIDEICFPKKRGVKKNMIKDNDDDNYSADNEWHILPVKEQCNSNLPPSVSENSKEIQEIQNSPNGDIKDNTQEKISIKHIDNTSVDLQLKELVAVKVTNNYEGTTNTTIKEQNNIDLMEKDSLDVQSTNSLEEITHDDIKLSKTNSIESSVNFKRSSTEVKAKIILDNLDGNSIDSEDSEGPLIKCKLRSRTKTDFSEDNLHKKIKVEDGDTISINSEENETSAGKRKKKFTSKKVDNVLEDPAFVKYLELRQDAVIDEHPELSHDEIVSYMYQTWLYEENIKSDIKKTDEIEQSTMVKGLKEPPQQSKKVRRKIPKTEKSVDDDSPSKPKRKSVKPFYNEEYSDFEEELEVYEIFKPRNIKIEGEPSTQSEPLSKEVEVYNEVELYFAELTKPKPNIFKGLIREKVCDICEKIGNLVKCKGCNGMFHVDCVKKQVEITDVPTPTPKGRKKKKKLTQKSKTSEEFDNDNDISEENNVSIDDILEADSHTVDADVLESQLSAKMKEMLDSNEKIDYDSYSSDDGVDWNEAVPGKCEIIDIVLKPRVSVAESDFSDFKCNDCQKYDTPLCFVCKGAISSKESAKRQNCNVAHCHKYYHLDCLEHWPQTQFNGGEPSKNSKKFNEHYEAFTCPRHVCHTCVSDDPRGCKTRFSGDKLARCVRCPATYHSFTKCLPAGSQILTASHIICPRHHESRPGKAPCHVNTGWCFICALGGSLICCEYCPTSFHAECLNIDPPEGGYMCEDCETGRLPLYGEMVWVKLGHYRWWPGIILHPYEIPENLLMVKHSPGEFVVRFFGQYDHYWVNRGRVFPFQEGDSGRISTNKSKIDAAFITAVEHAQRACEILKSAQPNDEESLDIASSLLPPHYVKLKVNKPCGSLCGRKLEDPESSLTQCECNPHDEDPCGPYSQCLNRMLLTECGPVCRAGDRCNNRAFEKRLYPKLVPYRTPSRGWGLKTLEDIKAGQFVIEYVGELIDEEEFRRRMRRKHEMRDENFYFLTLDKERMIDAGPKGNLARFMNHCCEPNCETQKWTVLGDVRVGLFALFDIPAQSEVTFNYNLECAGIDKKRCMCGAKRCSGYIGAKPKQEESQTKKYRMHPVKRTYKKRKPEESPSTKIKIKRPIGRPPKPKELTEIEKDLLIIRNATNGISSDESSRSLSSEFDRHPKALKRKRVSFSSDQNVSNDVMALPDVKKSKLVDKLEGD